MSILKNHLSKLTGALNEDMGDMFGGGDTPEVGATGKTAHKPTASMQRTRARKNDIAQLTRELGRQPTNEEIDLVFGDLDAIGTTRTHIEGNYGRDEEIDDEGMETRRPERGPTARRFRESNAEGSQLGMSSKPRGRLMEAPQVDDDLADQAAYYLGRGFAAAVAQNAEDYMNDLNNDFPDNPAGPQDAILQLVMGACDEICSTEEFKTMLGLSDDQEFKNKMIDAATEWCSDYVPRFRPKRLPPATRDPLVKN